MAMAVATRRLRLRLLALVALGGSLIAVDADDAVIAEVEASSTAPETETPATDPAPIEMITLADREVHRVGKASSSNRGVIVWLPATGTEAATAAEWWSRAPALATNLIAYCPSPASAAWLERRDGGFLRAMLREIRRHHPDLPIVLAGSGGGARIIGDIALASSSRIHALVLFDGLPVPPYRQAKSTSPAITFYRGRLDRNLSAQTAHRRVQALEQAGYRITAAVAERDRNLDHHAWEAVTAPMMEPATP